MKPIRVGLGQINPTVGDFSANLRKILSFLALASEKRCDLLVFPELAVSGYPVWDLAIKKSFIRESLRSVGAIVGASRRFKGAVIVGFLDEGPAGSGKSRNALAWIEGGRVRLRQYKSLLPTYDVFLEQIFFEPGLEHPTLSWKGLRVGTAICEDLWDTNYTRKPLRILAREGAKLVILGAASLPEYQPTPASAQVFNDLALGYRVHATLMASPRVRGSALDVRAEGGRIHVKGRIDHEALEDEVVNLVKMYRV